MQEWRKFFKVISCNCGKFLIIDLETCDSRLGEERYGHILTKEGAEKRAEELYLAKVLEDEVIA